MPASSSVYVDASLAAVAMHQACVPVYTVTDLLQLKDRQAYTFSSVIYACT